MRAIVSDARDHHAPLRLATGVRAWLRRAAVALSVAVGFGACAAADAGAFTLTLVFPDGQPMTYGSACAGVGCLGRNDRVDRTDDRGRVFLPDQPRTIEYRRDGIPLGLAPVGFASGTIIAVGSSASVILPRMLIGSQPGVDAVESDLVARLNEVRAAQGLPLAQMNSRLAKSADFQATWLTQSGALLEPSVFHVGPFGTDLAFRHGEVSLPDPASGGEIAEAGGSIDAAVTDWLSSPEHRQQILAPGQQLIGAARSGSFLIVQTHKPCAGCEQTGTGVRSNAPPPPPPPPVVAQAPPAGAAPAAPTVGSTSAKPEPLPGCGREQLAARRLQNRGGRVRLRIGTRCLRPGARYVLIVREGTAGRVLRTMTIKRAGTATLAVKPARTAKRLRISFKRNGRAIVGRTMTLRSS